MNQRAARDALAASQVSMPARAVYLALLSHANGRGDCWPHQQTVADLAGMSTRNVKRMVVELRTAGLVEVSPRGRGNAYHLPVDKRRNGDSWTSPVSDPSCPQSSDATVSPVSGPLAVPCMEATGSTSELAPHFSPGTGWMREKRASGGR